MRYKPCTSVSQSSLTHRPPDQRLAAKQILRENVHSILTYIQCIVHVVVHRTAANGSTCKKFHRHKIKGKHKAHPRTLLHSLTTLPLPPTIHNPRCTIPLPQLTGTQTTFLPSLPTYSISETPIATKHVLANTCRLLRQLILNTS